MDLKKEILILLDDLGDEIKEEALRTVLIHIDRAEYFYQQAEINNDKQFYTDVLHRTNKVHRGVLRCAN